MLYPEMEGDNKVDLTKISHKPSQISRKPFKIIHGFFPCLLWNSKFAALWRKFGNLQFCFWEKQIWEILNDNSIGFGCEEEYTI